MITILIFAIFGFWLGFHDSFAATFFSILGGLLGFCIAILVGTTGIESDPTPTYSATLKIESLQDNAGIKGDFYLDSGYIEGSMKYAFYYEQSPGVYKMMTVDCDHAQVRYHEGQPKVDVYHGNIVGYWGLFSPASYVIEVPKGTINSTISLDAK